MNDPYGFLRFHRTEPRKRPAHERLRNWNEYVEALPEPQAQRQASRCMDCGIPYCHARCPVHNLIPEWNALVHERQWRAAYEQLESTNNFPELTGRLCPAPCEHACTLSLNDNPVSIKAIELAVAEHAWEAGWVRPARTRAGRGRPVAVVGSGPAGLACAQQLARAGYRVDLYEKADRIGGLLRYGIPDFRLDKAILDRRLGQMAAEGVRFHTGRDIRGAALARLRRRSRALVLACGCDQPRDVAVPGRDLAGIHYALEFLEQQNRAVAGRQVGTSPCIDAEGLDVVVIGGGDTGGDCLGTSVRQGARSVTQIQYHDQPPRFPDVLQYWPDPAPALEPSDHEEEGCKRDWGWDTVAFEGLAGQIQAVILQRLHWSQDAVGLWHKHRMPNALRRLPAQLVLIAVGYARPRESGPVRDLKLHLGPRGQVSANDVDYRTNLPGVFACGDMRRGQSLLVWAIREGRQCARAVDQWLSHHSDLPWV